MTQLFQYMSKSPLAATESDLSNGILLELSVMNKLAVRKKAISVAWALGALLIIGVFPKTMLVFLGLVLVCGT